jgi:hypothetical protein
VKSIWELDIYGKCDFTCPVLSSVSSRVDNASMEIWTEITKRVGDMVKSVKTMPNHYP